MPFVIFGKLYVSLKALGELDKLRGNKLSKRLMKKRKELVEEMVKAIKVIDKLIGKNYRTNVWVQFSCKCCEKKRCRWWLLGGAALFAAAPQHNTVEETDKSWKKMPSPTFGVGVRWQKGADYADTADLLIKVNSRMANFLNDQEGKDCD